MKVLKSLALFACLLTAATAQAETHIRPQPGFLSHDSDAVLPNSPWKENGMPDAGKFNPAGAATETSLSATDSPSAAVPAPAAMTHYPPAIVIRERVRKPYALVAAPTLPCAPRYCPARRARADRN